MEHMHELATLGHTVIASIHQPRSAIWDMFDKVHARPEPEKKHLDYLHGGAILQSTAQGQPERPSPCMYMTVCAFSECFFGLNRMTIMLDVDTIFYPAAPSNPARACMMMAVPVTHACMQTRHCPPCGAHTVRGAVEGIQPVLCITHAYMQTRALQTLQCARSAWCCRRATTCTLYNPRLYADKSIANPAVRTQCVVLSKGYNLYFV